MSALFQKGQAVVCVDMTQPVNTAFPPIETVMKLRGIYRISQTQSTLKCGQLVRIEGIPGWWWGASRFRPIVKAGAEFAVLVRSCRPVVPA